MLPKIAAVFTSAIDHPGKVSLNIFLPYCNFNCIACHNRELVEGRFEEIPLDKLIWELENNFIADMVVISGGEPTIYGRGLLELIKLIRRKRSDILVRVDSNGSLPEIMELLVGFVDGFAIDIKAPPLEKEKYEMTIRRDFNLDSLIRSVKIAAQLSHTIFRTVKYPWLSEGDIEKIKDFLSIHGGEKPYIVNPYFESMR